MKLIIPFATFFLLLATLPLAASNQASARPACCTAATPAALRAPFTEASIYNLESRWTNELARPVQLSSFHGQPVAIALFFAHCDYACPVLVHDLRKIEQALPPNLRAKIHFVLVTFDVERDTPELLARYKKNSQLGEHWSLLRGSAGDVQELAALLGVKYKKNSRGLFDHSNLITLLDAEGEIVSQQIGLNRDPEPAALLLQKMAIPEPAPRPQTKD